MSGNPRFAKSARQFNAYQISDDVLRLHFVVGSDWIENIDPYGQDAGIEISMLVEGNGRKSLMELKRHVLNEARNMIERERNKVEETLDRTRR